MQLAEIEYVGDAAAWTKLGFHVDPQTPSSPSPVVRLGDVVIRFSQSTLASSQAESTTTTGFGLQRLGFKGLPDGVNEIGGIPVYRCDGPLSGHPSAAQQINHHHPNTASGIDHVVLYAKHEEDLIKSFSGLDKVPSLRCWSTTPTTTTSGGLP